jgi:ribose transport system substrate-binding protein
MRRAGCLVILAALALTACDGAGEKPPAAPAAVKQLTLVGISVASLRAPYYAAIARGAEAAARGDTPTADVSVAADDYSALKQADQIDAFIKDHADIILLTPADPEGIGDAIARAHAAGIVVVAIDGPALGADAQVATDNIEAGALACEALAKALGGHGQVAILGGPAAPATTARALGCADAFARAPDIRVASFGADGRGTEEDARRAMRDVFGQVTQVDAVFAISDAEALGVADAATDLGRATLVAGADGSPAMETALTNRARANIVATAAIDPYAMGGNAFRVANDIRRGRQPESDERLLDPVLVTRDSAHDYKGWLAQRE